MQKLFVNALLLVELVIMGMLIVIQDFKLWLVLHSLAALSTLFIIRAETFDIKLQAFQVLMVFLMPVIGALLLYALLCPKISTNSVSHAEPLLGQWQEPLTVNSHAVDSLPDQQQTRRRLHALNQETHTELLQSAQQLPNAQAADFWWQAMAGTEERTRLMGYSFYSNLEDHLQQQLQAGLATLEQADRSDVLGLAKQHMALAYLYWQHIQIKPSKDNKDNELKEVISHALQSSRLGDYYTAQKAYRLLAQVLKSQNRYKEANYFLAKALSNKYTVFTAYPPKQIQAEI